MKRRERQQIEAQQTEAPDAQASGSGRAPSKSQRKRDSDALQQLGEALLTLQPEKLHALPLPEQLIDAVLLARRTHSREGLRRQRQYIGRLMRDVDPAPIRYALDLDGERHRDEVAAMHAAEHWRERLLDDPARLPEFLAEYPAAPQASASGDGTPEASPEPDADALALLIAGAKTERERAQPGRNYRALYRQLRDIIAAA